MCPRDTKKQESSISDATNTSGTTESSVAVSDKNKELIATHELCHYCFDVIIHELSSSKNRKGSSRNASNHTPSLLTIENILPSPDASCPLFVTWDKKVVRNSREETKHYELRGCIGTLASIPLVTALREYAILSAFRDGRFEPMRSQEVPFLRVAVSLLVNYEECKGVHDWIVGVHGILLKFKIGDTCYNATYLPEVAHEQGWTQEEAISSLIRKSGYYGNPHEIESSNLECIRYQSSKTWLTYDEYVQRCSTGSSNPSPAMTFIAPYDEDGQDRNNKNATSTSRSTGWRIFLPF
mmetsp:Transcript_4409/g.6532  ORF Transcript_4409/g.6532 Transcript_4409/m.6532 type:complete len:296 (+) Transcript_4409:265-1152(+)